MFVHASTQTEKLVYHHQGLNLQTRIGNLQGCTLFIYSTTAGPKLHEKQILKMACSYLKTPLNQQIWAFVQANII